MSAVSKMMQDDLVKRLKRSLHILLSSIHDTILFEKCRDTLLRMNVEDGLGEQRCDTQHG
jgi:hypothetical protein